MNLCLVPLLDCQGDQSGIIYFAERKNFWLSITDSANQTVLVKMFEMNWIIPEILYIGNGMFNEIDYS
jgi:hypothetical protein